MYSSESLGVNLPGATHVILGFQHQSEATVFDVVNFVQTDSRSGPTLCTRFEGDHRRESKNVSFNLVHPDRANLGVYR